MACRQIYAKRSTDGNTLSDLPNYASPTSPSDWTTTAVPGQPWLIASTAKSLNVRLSVAPGGGKSFTYTLEVDTGTGFADSAITFSIADAATSGGITTDVTLPAGCKVRLRRDSSGAPTIGTQWTTFAADGSNAGQSYHGIANFQLNTSVSRNWAPWTGRHTSPPSSSGNIVAAEGQVTGWSVELDGVPDPGTSYRIALIKNGVVQDGSGGTIDTAQTVDDTSSTSISWTGSLACAPGSQVYLNITPSNTPPNLIAGVGLSFLAVNDGESNVGHTSDATMLTSAGTYFASPMQGTSTYDWTATEANVEVYNDSPYAIVIRSLFAKMNLTPAASLTFSYRLNGANASGGPSVTLSGVTSNADTTNSFTVASGDRWNIQDVQTGSAGVARVSSVSSVMYAVVADVPNEDATSVVVTVQGVDYTPYVRFKYGIDISLLLNDRSSAHFDLLPVSFLPGNAMPPRLQDVVFYDGTTPIFGGVILTRETAAPDERMGLKPYYPRIRCVDYFVYFDWTIIPSFEVAVASTLKVVLEQLIGELPVGYGVTLDVSQPDGPTIDPFTKENVTPAEIVRYLSDVTGSVAVMSPFKALRMVPPGTDAAPFNISTATPNCQECTWTDPEKIPVTKYVLLIGPDGPTMVTATFSPTAGQTDFVTDFEATNPRELGVCTVTGPSITEPRYCTISGIISEPAMFQWDMATHTLSVDTYDDTFGAFDGTETLSFEYIAKFPAAVTVYSGSPPASPEVAASGRDATIIDLASGIAKAQQELAKLSFAARQADIQSLEHGWKPGQGLTINLPDRDVNATFILSEVNIHLTTPTLFTYRLTAQEADVYQGNVIDQWRRILQGGGMGGAGSAVAPSGESFIPASGVVTEAQIFLSDVLTDNVSIARHGFVPKAPNDATKVLLGDGTWGTAGTGDVAGPGVSVDGEIVLYDGTTGALIKRATGTGVVHAASGVYSAANVNLTSEVTGDLPFANLAQASGASLLLGRGSAGGAGDFQEISLGAGMSMSGTTLNTSGGGTGTVQFAVKGGQTDVTNSTTLVDATDLFFTAATGASYWFELLVLIASDSTAQDFKYTIDVSGGGGISGATAWWANETQSSTVPGWWGPLASGAPNSLNDLGSTINIGTSSTTATRQGLRITGLLVTTTTGGSVGLRFAQATLTGSVTVSVLAGSVLRYMKVA